MDSERFPAADGHAAEPETGDPRVDEAVAGLAALGGRPLEEHPQALEAAHDALREILGELGEPGRPGRPGLQGQFDGPGSNDRNNGPGSHDRNNGPGSHDRNNGPGSHDRNSGRP